MSNKIPQKQRRFLLPFKTTAVDDGGPYNLLMLNASNYSDAVKIARCVAGINAEKYLCYKDFSTDD